MKKTILAVLTVCALMSATAAHAQTTVVVQRPGLLSGLVDTAEALLLLPFAVAEGVVVGTVEAADAVLNGTTTVYTAPAPVYTAPAPVVVAPPPPVVAPAPSGGRRARGPDYDGHPDEDDGHDRDASGV